MVGLAIALVIVSAPNSQASDSKKALALLGACKQPTDARDIACVDRWLSTCARAREAGLSPRLDAEALVQIGSIWAETMTRGCPCCEHPALFQGTNPKEMAVFAYRKALAVWPAGLVARRKLVGRLVDDDATIEALTVATEGTRLTPEAAGAHALVGHVNSRLQRWRPAADAYLTAARMSMTAVERARYLVDSATASLAAGAKPVDVVPLYQEAIRLHPTWARPRAECAWVWSLLGNLSEAKREFSEAIRLQPSYFSKSPPEDPVRKAYESVVLGLGNTPVARQPGQTTATGSGFFVSSTGLFVTNHHVIAGATTVRVRVGNSVFPSKVILVDRPNDLAVLQVGESEGPHGEGRTHFQALAVVSAGLRLGASVVTVGFPNPTIQGLQPKLTRGEISSLAGIQDDPRHFQISVPIQPGNSGGPLADVRGNVVGIVVAGLADDVAYEVTGSVPQNVNYAVKGAYLAALLSGLPGIEAVLPAPSTTTQTTEELALRLTRAAGLVLAERRTRN
jgi:S1-C subfamily serine protease